MPSRAVRSARFPGSPLRRPDGWLEDAVAIIDGWLAYQRGRRRIPGMSVGIVHGEAVVFTQGYGYANEAARRPATATTGYRIASISKVFTATAVMQLVERGAVRLDERADRYVPWIRGRNRSSPPVTVRQLLSHTAGVERDGTPHWVTDRFPTLDQLKARARQGLTVLPPLERWKYSNTGYALLGEVVASASGQPYDEYVQANILAPLGLRRTGFAITPEVLKTLAAGYGRERQGRSREVFPNPDTRAWRPAAGLVSTAADLCAFMSAQFQGSGRLLTDLSKREMQRPQWLRADEGQYGLGLAIWPLDGAVITGHGGGFQGFSTAIGMDMDRRIGVTVLTNLIEPHARPLLLGVFHTIHGCIARLERRPARPSRRAALRRYVGRYTARWLDRDIVLVGDRLFGANPGDDRPLLDASELDGIGPHRFKIIEDLGGGNIGEAVEFETTRTGVVRGLRWGSSPMRRVRRIARA
ncbi:MAG TPA: serine hydrolase domain-containing protein [bacterium]|nr:serine hydrolase domain-containing protein [bacterium]